MSPGQGLINDNIYNTHIIYYYNIMNIIKKLHVSQWSSKNSFLLNILMNIFWFIINFGNLIDGAWK